MPSFDKRSLPPPTSKTFQLPAENRVLGVIMYLIAGPFIAIILLLGIYGICASLMAFAKFPETPVVVGGWVAGLAAIVWLTRFVIADFNRRAGISVTVAPDSLTTVCGGQVASVLLDDVDSIRLIPHDTDAICELILMNEGTHRLPVEVAPFSTVQDALDEMVIGRLADRLSDDLTGGASIVVAESHFLATWRVFEGSFRLARGFLEILSIVGIVHGVPELLHGIYKIRSGRSGMRTNYEINRDGLVPLAQVGGSASLLWSQLSDVRDVDTGLVLTFADGQTFQVSRFAEDFLPFARWITGRPLAGNR